MNYFGKWTDLNRISISPIILKKRNTHVALYGLSYINDQRLSRLYRDEKVYLFQAYFPISNHRLMINITFEIKWNCCVQRT